MSEGTETLRLGTRERKLDPAALQQGRECTPPPYMQLDGVTVWVLPAAMYNPRCRKALQNLRPDVFKDVLDKIQESEDEAEQNEAVGEAIEELTRTPEFVVDALVADIDGLYNVNGNPIKYTRERGLKILGDPGYADVLDWIVTEAKQLGKFYNSTVEEDAGN